jgi:hypothetical protein
MRLSQLILGLLLSTLGLTLTTNVFGQTQSFRCNFSDGFVSNWESGKTTSKRDGRMSELIFDQVDLKKGSGRMIGNSGSENVQVLTGDTNSIHIVERTPSGNMNITTIFTPSQKNPNEFPVVHSRHINLMGGPLVSQFVGLCKKLN